MHNDFQILVIEDDKNVRAMLCQFLQQDKQYQVVEAVNGHQALEICKARMPDLILLDTSLPDIDGYTVCQQIQSLPQGNQTPVLLILSANDEDLINRAFECGAADYLVRPLHLSALRNRLRYLSKIKESEKTRQASQQLLLKVVTSAPVILFALNNKGIITLLEGQALDALDLKPGSLIGQSVYLAFQHLPSVMEGIKQALKGEESSRVITFNNLIFETRFSPLKDEHGKIEGVVSVSYNITEWQQAEDDVRKLYRAVEQSANSIVITNLEGTIEYVNPHFTEVTGYTLKEALGENPRILKADTGQTPAEEYENLWATITAGKEWRGEFCNRRKNGELFWERASISPIKDAEGRITHFLAVKEDITEYKKAENELKRLSRVVEQSPSLVIITDASGNIQYVNPAFTRHSGYTLEEVRGQNPRVLKSGYTPLATYQNLWDTITAGKEWRGELLDRAKTGELYWISATFSSIKNGTGDIAYYVAVQEDITARRQAEQELRKLSQAVEQSANSVIITNLAGNIEYVNPKFTEVTGYTPSEVLGQNPRVLQAPEVPKPQEEYKELWKAISSGGEWRGEFCNRRKNGELFWEMATLSAIKNSHGEVTHYLAVKEDITKRKKAEEELRRYADELAARNRELDAYSHTIAHDLKSPLSVVGGYAGLIARHYGHLLPEMAMDYVDKIKSSVNTMTTMIDQLLYLAKLRDASETVVPVDMNKAARNALSRFEGELMDKPIQIHLEPDLPVAAGHSAWLEEVFANLIGNAIKYMDESRSEQRITIRGYVQDKRGRYEVEDTGPGIAPENQKQLFEMFTRFDKTGKEHGFGLGLSIVHRIITHLHGQVNVESVPGKGSTFWFMLPLANKSSLD